MVFTNEDKIVIKNDIEEYGLNAYEIWRNHEKKNWDRVSVRRLVKRYLETGTMDRKKGSGRPVSATNEENTDVVEELICSQEEPGSHHPPREISKELEVGHMSVRRMAKKRKINQFKRAKAPDTKPATKKRRVERASQLTERLEKNRRMVEKFVWQDEKDFPLQVPTNAQNNRVYFKGRKSDVPVENLYHKTNRQCEKVMVSAALTWNGATRPFFVNNKGLKVNAVRYRHHLKKELFPAIEKVITRDDWVFVQDGATSHTANITQEFLKNTLKRRFVKSDEWPPNSPDCNPLDYYFWNAVKEKVYKGRINKPFQNVDELKKRIRKVWKECASAKCEIRKAIRQFAPRLHAVKDLEGASIKMLFG